MVANTQSPPSPSAPESAANPANPAGSPPIGDPPFATSPPPLSPRDSALLSSLIRSNFDLSQTAFDHGLGLHELTDWLRSEAIQSLIADLLKSSQAILEIRLTRARMETVGILETIAKTSEDPTERRRAATALFHRPFARPKDRTYRLYSLPPPPQVPPFTTPPRAPDVSSPFDAPSPSSPMEGGGGGAGVFAGGGGSVSTSSTNSPISSDPAAAPQAHNNSNPAPPSLPSSHHHLITPTPCPRGIPTPSSLASLLNAFHTRNTKALLHAFRSHSTPDATLDNRPLLTVFPLHPLSQMHISREIAYTELSRTPTRAGYTFTFDRAPLSPARASFRFDFARSETQGWLIAAITTLDSS